MDGEEEENPFGAALSEWVTLREAVAFLSRRFSAPAAEVAREMVAALRSSELAHRVAGFGKVDAAAWLPDGLSRPGFGDSWGRRVVVGDWEAAAVDWREGTVAGRPGPDGKPSRHAIEVPAARLEPWFHGTATALRIITQGAGQKPPAERPAANPPVPAAASQLDTQPPGAPRPVYSESALRSWYRLRCHAWPADHPPPGEADDLAAAAEYFGVSIPRDRIRAIRRELAPQHWRKPGPRRPRA